MSAEMPRGLVAGVAGCGCYIMGRAGRRAPVAPVAAGARRSLR